jgi:hypothetical protein
VAGGDWGNRALMHGARAAVREREGGSRPLTRGAATMLVGCIAGGGPG